MQTPMNRRAFLAAPLLAAGCFRTTPQVVLCCAAKGEYAEELLAEFTRETGIRVVAQFDTPIAEVEQQAGRPRCDVHWNNDPLASTRLARAGAYAPLPITLGDAFPADTRAPYRLWQGFAARARVLIVNTELVRFFKEPRSVADLAHPRWKGRAAIAKPFTGTTATHAACLAAVLGIDRAEDFFFSLQENRVNVVAGNQQVARDVADGRFAFGLTDSDDAIIEVRAGKPVEVVFPADDIGTLFLPNTLALMKHAPNPSAAQKLVEFLLRPETEKRLAERGGFQIPLNPAVKVELPAAIQRPSQVRAMWVNLTDAAELWDETQAILRDLFAA